MRYAERTRQSEPPRATQTKRKFLRLRGLVLAAVGGLSLALAASLTPNANGHGTHRQMGSPSCSVLTHTGYPCPGCGMTTSVAAMAHGQIGLALKAQPFGVVLFFALVAAAGLGIAELLTGRDIVMRSLRPRTWWLWAAMAGLLGGWAIKLAVGIAAGEYPTH